MKFLWKLFDVDQTFDILFLENANFKYLWKDLIENYDF